MTTSIQTPKPTKPWRATPKSLAPTFTAAVIVIVGTFLLIDFTGLSGKLGAFAAASILAIVALSIAAFLQRGVQAAKNAAVGTIVAVGAIIALFPVVSILGNVASLIILKFGEASAEEIKALMAAGLILFLLPLS